MMHEVKRAIFGRYCPVKLFLVREFWPLAHDDISITITITPSHHRMVPRFSLCPLRAAIVALRELGTGARRKRAVLLSGAGHRGVFPPVRRDRRLPCQEPGYRGKEGERTTEYRQAPTVCAMYHVGL